MDMKATGLAFSSGFALGRVVSLPSSGMCSTETTLSSASVLKMRTPCVLRPAMRTSSTGQRMSWPPSVTSMIWSLSATGNEATSGRCAR